MVHGECQPQFRAVRDALEENLRDPLELGEGVAVVIDGETVVDLWGGHRDAERTLEWEANTLACFFSVGKPIAALALGQLIEAGHMHLDDRVSDHWPGFGQAGKEETTIDQAISHLAGIPGAFGAPRGSAYEWSAMIAAIEAQAPLWPPGTTGCYHTFTYGHIVGELARRASGRTIGELIRTNITEPLGLDLGFALTPAECSRCADVQMTKGDPLMESIKGEETLIGRCWSPLPLGPDEEDFNTEACRRAEMPSFNGHGTARALATLYSSLAMSLSDDAREQPFSPSLVRMLTAEQWSGTDPLGLNNRMARGFRLANQFSPFNGGERAFGHGGIGGALGFADPDRGLGFGYVTNRLAPGPGASPYAMRLVAALERTQS